MSAGTFKVDQAVPIEVNVVQDLVHLPLGEALPQQDLEGRSELPQADAAVPVGVELWQRWAWRGVANDGSLIHAAPHSQQTGRPPPALRPGGPHLSEGVPQFPDSDHVRRLGQQLGAHQLHKVFKVHLPATWEPRSSGTPGVIRDPCPAQALPSLQAPQAGSSVVLYEFP